MYIRRLAIICIAGLFLGACGGGGSRTNVQIEGSQQAPLEINSLHISDMILSGFGFPPERVTDVYCLSDLSQCQATYGGQTFTFEPEPDSNADGTIFTTLGTWNHTRVGAVHVGIQGLQARYALAGGVTHPNSLFLSGSATWKGEMVALDSNNRVIRGDASLTIPDFNNPSVDARLEPQSRAVMTWTSIPVISGAFSQRGSTTDYIKGEFYGPHAEEAGGVFERNQLIGAFAAKR